MKNIKLLILILCLLLTTNANAQVGKSILVEVSAQWYPATIAEEKENLGVKAYKVTYTASGGQEWVAPNRVLLDINASKPTVGETKKLPENLAVGATVNIEYNGGWYPGKLGEIGALAGTPIYKVTYTQSGLSEYVAANQLKVAPWR